MSTHFLNFNIRQRFFCLVSEGGRRGGPLHQLHLCAGPRQNGDQDRALPPPGIRDLKTYIHTYVTSNVLCICHNNNNKVLYLVKKLRSEFWYKTLYYICRHLGSQESI